MYHELPNPDILHLDSGEPVRPPVEAAAPPSDTALRRAGHRLITAVYVSEMAATQPSVSEAA